jgi:hypothetical protein
VTLDIPSIRLLYDLIVVGVKDVFLKAGVAIIALLKEQILLSSLEKLQMQFRSMVRSVAADDLIPLLLQVEIKYSRRGDKDRSDDDVLSVSTTQHSHPTVCNDCCLPENIQSISQFWD